MHAPRSTRPLLLALTLVGACETGSAGPAGVSKDDVTAFLQALPRPGSHDRVFLALEPALAARLAIDTAAVRAVDPGLACDPSATTPAMSEAALGDIGRVQTICTPAGWSQGMLTLRNGASYVTTCGEQAAPRIEGRLTLGDHSWHVSNAPAAAVRALTHDCTGWTKVSG